MLAVIKVLNSNVFNLPSEIVIFSIANNLTWKWPVAEIISIGNHMRPSTIKD